MILVKYDPQTRAVVQYPYTLQQLRRDNPQFCFASSGLLDSDLTPFGVGVVKPTQPQLAGRSGYTSVENDPVFENDEWVQRWDVVQISAKQREMLTRDAAKQVADTRNQLLTASDWVTLPDVALTPSARREWLMYREALRDVTKQPGYPLDVTWPTRESFIGAVPSTITLSQYKWSLEYNGLLEQAEKHIPSIDPRLRGAWNYGTKVSKSDQLIVVLGKLLGLNSDHVDAIFDFGSLQY